jgi:Ca2+-binding RTX toxin-like protein
MLTTYSEGVIMSLLRTIKKNIARNRAKALNRPMQSDFKLEALEPRLLLSANLTDDQANNIINNLSHYALPALSGMTMADLVKSEAQAQSPSKSAKEFLNQIGDSTGRNFDLDLTGVTNKIGIDSLAGLSLKPLTVGNNAATADISGSISLDTNGSLNTANLTVNNLQVITGTTFSFGFLDTNISLNSTGTNLNIVATVQGDGTITYTSSDVSLSIGATLTLGTSFSDVITAKFSPVSGKFTYSDSGDKLSEFANVSAQSVAGQFKSLTDWAGKLGASDLFTGSTFDSGILSSDSISKALDLGKNMSNKLLYNTDPTAVTKAILFSNSDLAQPNFSGVTSLINKLKTLTKSDATPTVVTPSFASDKLSLTFTFGIPVTSLELPADFHVQYGSLASISSSSALTINGTLDLSLTIGIDLADKTLPDASTVSINPLKDDTRFVVAPTAIALNANRILGADAVFEIGYSNDTYRVTIPQSASLAFATESDIANYLNITALKTARKNGGTPTSDLTVLGFSAVGTSGSGTLSINNTAAFTLSFPQFSGSDSVQSLGLTGKMLSTNNQYVQAFTLTPSYNSSETYKLPIDAGFAVTVGGVAYTVTVPKVTTASNSSFADLALSINAALKIARTIDSSGIISIVDLTGSTNGGFSATYNTGTKVLALSASLSFTLDAGVTNYFGFPGQQTSLATSVQGVCTPMSKSLVSDSNGSASKFQITFKNATYDVTVSQISTLDNLSNNDLAADIIAALKTAQKAGVTVDLTSSPYGFTIAGTGNSLTLQSSVDTFTYSVPASAPDSLGLSVNTGSTTPAVNPGYQASLASGATVLASAAQFLVIVGADQYVVSMPSGADLSNAANLQAFFTNARMVGNTAKKLGDTDKAYNFTAVFQAYPPPATTGGTITVQSIGDHSTAFTLTPLVNAAITDLGFDAKNTSPQISFQGVLGAFMGRLGSVDATININIKGTPTSPQIVISAAATNDNRSMDDLVADINDAIANQSALKDKVVASAVGTHIEIATVRTPVNAASTNSTQLQVSNGGNPTAFGILGFTGPLTGALAYDNLTITPENAAAVVGTLASDAFFKVDLGGTTYKVVLTKDAAKTDVNGDQLAGKLNTALQQDKDGSARSLYDLGVRAANDNGALRLYKMGTVYSPDSSFKVYANAVNAAVASLGIKLCDSPVSSWTATTMLPTSGVLTSDALFVITLNTTSYQVYISADSTKTCNNAGDLATIIGTAINAVVPTANAITVISDSGNLKMTAKTGDSFTLSAFIDNSASADLGLPATAEAQSSGYLVSGSTITTIPSTTVTFNMKDVNGSATYVVTMAALGSTATAAQFQSALNLALNNAKNGANSLANVDAFTAVVAPVTGGFSVTIISTKTLFEVSGAGASALGFSGPTSGIPVSSVSGGAFVQGRLSDDATIVFSINGTDSNPITISEAKTLLNSSVSDLAAQIQAQIDADSGLTGKIAVFAVNGRLVFRNLNNATQFSVKKSSSSSAVAFGQLGFITTSAQSSKNDIRVYCNNGNPFTVDLHSCSNLQAVIGAINTASGGSVTAKMGDNNNLVLVDNSQTAYSIGAFRIETINGSNMGAQLGLIQMDGSVQKGVITEDADGVIKGASLNTDVVSSLKGFDIGDRFNISGLTFSGSIAIAPKDATNGLAATAVFGPVSAKVKVKGGINASISMEMATERSLNFLRDALQQGTLATFLNTPPTTALTGALDAALAFDSLPTDLFSGGTLSDDLKVNFLNRVGGGTIPGNFSITPPTNVNLLSLSNININSIKDLIVTNLPQIIDLLLSSEQFNNATIPLVNKKIKDIITIKQQIVTAVDRLRNSEIFSVQQIEEIVESSLGLSPGTMGFEIDSVQVPDPLDPSKKISQQRINFKLHYTNSVSSTLSLDAGGTPISYNSMSIGFSGAAGFNVTGSLVGTLHFGFNIPTDLSLPSLYLFNDTSISATLGVHAKNIAFGLSMGPASLGVKGGQVDIGATAATGITDSNGNVGDTSFVFAPGSVYLYNPTLTGTIDGHLDVSLLDDTTPPATIYLDGWNSSTKARTDTALISDVLNGSPVFATAVGGSTDYPVHADDGSIQKTTDSNPGSNLILVDVSGVISKAADLIGDFQNFANLSIFDKINLVLDGLNMFLNGSQKLVNDKLSNVTLPAVGKIFANGANFLESVRDNVVDKLRSAIADAGSLVEDSGAKKIAEQLYNVLGGNGGLGLLTKYSGNIDTPSGTPYTAGDLNTGGISCTYKFGTTDHTNDFAQWNFTLGGYYTVSKDAAFDLGVPGISLDIDGKSSVVVKWSLDLGLGLNAKDGFYIAFNKNGGKELECSIILTPPETMKGSLGFLEASVTRVPDAGHLNRSLTLKGGVALDLSGTPNAGGVESATMDTLSNLVPKVSFFANVDMDLGLTLGVLSDSTKKSFPSLSAEFLFNWGTSTGGDDTASGITRAGFSGIQLNMGEYVSNVLSPFLSGIQKYTQPVQPLISFLTTPLPILKDIGMSITPIDLAAQIGKVDPGMVYAIADIINVVNSFKFPTTGSGALMLPFGDFYLVDTLDTALSGLSVNLNSLNFLKSRQSSDAVGEMLGKFKDQANAIEGAVQGALKGSSDDASTTFSSVANIKHGKWAFPIIQDPLQIFGLLTGKNVDLVTYDMPQLMIDFNFSQFFPIVGPIGATIGINFGTTIQFSFGYDTLGISEFVKNNFSNSALLLDGLYLKHDKGTREVNLHGGLTAAVSINLGIAEAGVGGGVGISVDFSLHDPNQDGKVRLGELEADFLYEWNNGSQLLAPLAIFDVSGKIYAELFAYLRVGWGWFSYTQHWQITPKITIVNFDVKFKRDQADPPPILATEQPNGDLLINAGPDAAKRVNGDVSDDNENFTVAVASDYTASVTMGSVTDPVKYHVKPKGKIIFNGGLSNDTLKVTGTNLDVNLKIDGGAGDDNIDLSGFSAASSGNNVTVQGGGGKDIIIGSKGAEENDLFGNSGDDTITAKGSGTNFIFGDEGSVSDATVIGLTKKIGDGNDTLTNGGSGKTFIFGGGNTGNPLNDPKVVNDGKDIITGGAGIDYLIGDGGIIKFTDATRATIIKNNPKSGGVEGASDDLGGDDTIVGKGGDDFIYGGGGADQIDGGAGIDTIDAGAGNDIVFGGSGDDSIVGGSGEDLIFGDRPLTTFNSGDTFVESIRTFSTSWAETAASDTGSAGKDTISGEEGNDIIFGDDGANGTTGVVDTISGGKGADLLAGDGGDDTIFGGDDPDVLIGGLGGDTLSGGKGSDIVFGDKGYKDFQSGSTTTPTKQENVWNTAVFGQDIMKAYGYVLKTHFGINGTYAGKNDPTVSPTVSNGYAASINTQDNITSDDGSDFLDGQSGYDTYSVKLQGNAAAYINISDSGAEDSNSDPSKRVPNGGYLSILGTADPDTFLLRKAMNGLGMVTLFNADGSIERMNYWAHNSGSTIVGSTIGINNLQVDGSVGNDNFFVDDAAVPTTLRGSVGMDTFQIGQQFNSPRDANANLQPEDFFLVDQTSLGTYISAGISGTMSVYGGDGDDTFTVLRNQEVLSLFGENGDDTFIIKAFLLRDGKTNASTTATQVRTGGGRNKVSYAINAPVNIIGGSGFDTVRVIGTEGDDKFVVTDKGVYGAGLFVGFESVESLTLDAAEGNDRIFILSTSDQFETIIAGGAGSDTFTVGGTGLDEVVTARDYKGYSGIISHTVVSSGDAAYKNVKIDGISLNIVDTTDDLSTAPDVLVEQTDKAGNVLRDNTIELTEGQAETTFTVRLARNQSGVSLNLAPPAISDDDKARGLLPITLSSGTIKANSTDGSLLVPLSTSPVAIKVQVPADPAKTGYKGLITGPMIQFISMTMQASNAIRVVNPLKVVIHDAQTPEIIVNRCNKQDDGIIALKEGNSALTDDNALLVKLSKAPSGDVVVALGSDDGRVKFSDGTNIISSITFHASDYDTAQKIFAICPTGDGNVTGITLSKLNFAISSSVDTDSALTITAEETNLHNNSTNKFVTLYYRPMDNTYYPSPSTPVNRGPEVKFQEYNEAKYGGDHYNPTPVDINRAQISKGLFMADSTDPNGFAWYIDGDKLIFVDSFGNNKPLDGKISVLYNVLLPGYYHATATQSEDYDVSKGKRTYVSLMREAVDTDPINKPITVTLDGNPVLLADSVDGGYKAGSGTGTDKSKWLAWYLAGNKIVFVNGLEPTQKGGNETVPTGSKISVTYTAYDMVVAKSVSVEIGDADAAQVEIIKNNGALDLVETDNTGSSSNIGLYTVRLTKIPTSAVTISLDAKSLSDVIEGVNQLQYNIEFSTTGTGGWVNPQSPGGFKIIFDPSDPLFKMDQTVYVRAVKNTVIENDGNKIFAAQARSVDHILGKISIDGAGGYGSFMDGKAMTLPGESTFIRGSFNSAKSKINLDGEVLIGQPFRKTDKSFDFGAFNTSLGTLGNLWLWKDGDLMTAGELVSFTAASSNPTKNDSNVDIAIGATTIAATQANLVLTTEKLTVGTLSSIFTCNAKNFIRAGLVASTVSAGVTVYNWNSLKDLPVLIIGKAKSGTACTSTMFRILKATGNNNGTGSVTIQLNDALDFTNFNYYAVVSNFPVGAGIEKPVAPVEDTNADVDKLYINSQDSMLGGTTNLSEYSQGGNVGDHPMQITGLSMGTNASIIFGSMEQLEVNFGKAIDTVNVNATLFDDAAYNTDGTKVKASLTVLNTGGGDDTVNVGSLWKTSVSIPTIAHVKESITVDNTGNANADLLANYANYYVRVTDAVTNKVTLRTISSVTVGAGNTLTVKFFGSELQSTDIITVNKYSHGPLAVNTQDGNDTIQFKSGAVSDVDMYCFGGKGTDTINVGTGNNVAFGDEGEAVFDDGITLGGPNDLPSDDRIVTGKRAVVSVQSTASATFTLSSKPSGLDALTMIGRTVSITYTVSGVSRIINRLITGTTDSTISVDAVPLLWTTGTGVTISANMAVGTAKAADYSINAVTFSTPAGDVDTITASGGKNIVIGGAAGDIITTKSGSDNDIIGDDGALTYLSGVISKAQSLGANGGADTITLKGGNNAVIAGAKGDTVIVDNGYSGQGNYIIGDNGVLSFESGLLKSATSADIDTVGGSDFIEMFSGDNVAIGGADADYINVDKTTGNPILGIASGNDIIVGDSGEVQFDVSSGVSLRLSVKSYENYGGNDHLFAGGGDNVIMGGTGCDYINVDALGKPVLMADTGNDIIVGDNGLLTYEIISKVSVVKSVTTNHDDKGMGDIIYTGLGSDIILGGQGGDTINAGDAGGSIIVGDNGEVVYKNTTSSHLRDYITTVDRTVGGVDVITTGAGNDTILGGKDGDIISTGKGVDIALGDDGTVQYASGLLSSITTIDNDFGGDDTITGLDGDKRYMGGFGNDAITSQTGYDVILGDGGIFNFNTSETLIEANAKGIKFGGNDKIDAGIGQNTVIGGLGDDQIISGVNRQLTSTDIRDIYSNDMDVVVGDNGRRTFEKTGVQPDGLTSATLSFNFQGLGTTGIGAVQAAGAPGSKVTNWMNIKGTGPGSYGNDAKEVVTTAGGRRLDGLVLSYGGKEKHRTDSIALQSYVLNQPYNPATIKDPATGQLSPGDGYLFYNGVMTTAPNSQCDNKMEVEMDGLNKYFKEYKVIVYIDAPSANSSLIENPSNSPLGKIYGKGESIRKVNLVSADYNDSFYTDDAASTANAAYNTFDGHYYQATAKTAIDAFGKYANYVVFEGCKDDRFVVTITDGVTNINFDGLDIPSIAGIQIIGTFHPVDNVETSTTETGGSDVISTGGGDDLVMGGAGSDAIATFGDIRAGIYDADTVIGDNGTASLMYRSGWFSLVNNVWTPKSLPAAISNAQSKGFDAAVSLTGVQFNDIIFTGSGNDVVIGGDGQDRINTQRQDDIASTIWGGDTLKTTPEALMNANITALQNFETSTVKVMSLNFAYSFNNPAISDSTIQVPDGQYAGVVAAKNWNNVMFQDQLSPIQYPNPYTNTSFKLSDGTVATGLNLNIQARDVAGGQATQLQGDRSNNGHDQVINDSDNAKLFKGYYWSQKQQQIEINVNNIGVQTGFDTYDVYVYIDGDNERTDDENYVFEIKGGDLDKNIMSSYYLNDWKGYTFNGEFRQVTATTYTPTAYGIVPNMEMVGNYVVFRNVTAKNFALRIKNLKVGTYSPLNMPCVAGIQFVSGSGRAKVAAADGGAGNVPRNGDFDKDVVLGDNGQANYMLDIPFGMNDNVSIAQNKAYEAISNIATFNSGTAASQNDYIVTGRNQDLVLGGNGSDMIDSGVGDDVVMGDNAQIEMIDYNPIGVRLPMNLRILDSTSTDNDAYIGKPGSTAAQMQSKITAGGVIGVKTVTSTLTGNDLVDAGNDDDLVYGQEGNDMLIADGGSTDVQYDTTGTNTLKTGSYATAAAYTTAMADVFTKLDASGAVALREFIANNFAKTSIIGAIVGGTPYDISSMQATQITMQATEEAVLTAANWPGKGGSALNVVLDFAAVGTAKIPNITLSWVVSGVTKTATIAAGLTTARIDIPDSPNDGSVYTIKLKAVAAGTFTVKLTNA